MKKTIFLLGITLTTYFSSCKDDVIGNRVENPVETGDEVLFGSSMAGTGAGTRTVYGDRTELGVPVYWKESGDDIAIFCLQSSQPANHLVNYTVKPVLNTNGKPTEVAASVTKINPEEAGLQWGTGEEHRFYAFYPATAVEGSDEENQTGKITAKIPVTQQVQEWRIAETEEEGAIDGMKTYFGLPNMDYAYMYAFKKVNKSEVAKDKPIELTFHNLVTVLDITVRGPETGDAVTVTNINVTAVDGQNPILTGDFTCNIRAAEDGNALSATCEAAGDLNEVRNLISIPCYDKKEGKYITLKSGECLNVKAYLIPDDDVSHKIEPRTLKITVATLNGGSAKERTLEQSAVTPHKINRVLLPKLIPGGTNYWLSSLDPNIYLSELSVPGSKFSVLTKDNRADIVYQTQTIQKQFEDGVRAFLVQTGCQANYSHVDFTPGTGHRPEQEKFQDGELYVAVDSKRLTMTFGDFLKGIKESIDKANAVDDKGKTHSEFAFVNVTFSDGASKSPCSGNFWGNHYNHDNYEGWMKTIEYKLRQYAGDESYGLYTGEITSNTTLADVEGKIIVRVEYNKGQDKHIAAGAKLPALFQWWNGPYQENGIELRWGAPQGNAELRSFYQEVTTVSRDNNPNVNAEALKSQKETWITNLFTKSVDMYKNNGEHNIWFMNDLGGYYVETKNPSDLSIDMNKMAVDQLQGRSENAGLGLIYMNFADKQSDSGAKYKSDWLIQTIIDNNFKFALRKKGSTPTRTEYVTRMNGDGWDE